MIEWDLTILWKCTWSSCYFADDESEVKKKKKPTWNGIAHKTQLGSDNADSSMKNIAVRHNVRMPHMDGSFTLKETVMHETSEVMFSLNQSDDIHHSLKRVHRRYRVLWYFFRLVSNWMVR